MTALALGAVDALPAVGLQELVAAAELLVRVDRKYLLADDALPGLLAELPAGTRALEVSGQREIDYRSLYYDTDALDAYRATAQRRRRRFKVRTREYGTGGAYLEVKTRRGDCTVKERVAHEADGPLDDEAAAYVSGRLADAGIPHTGPVSPVLRTLYRRSTLLLPDGARVTLDSGLTWATLDGQAVDCPRLTVVETKSRSQACAADRALWTLGHRPVPLSKYGTGLAALRPDLPRNRWHRLLDARIGLPHAS